MPGRTVDERHVFRAKTRCGQFFKTRCGQFFAEADVVHQITLPDRRSLGQRTFDDCGACDIRVERRGKCLERQTRNAGQRAADNRHVVQRIAVARASDREFQRIGVDDLDRRGWNAVDNQIVRVNTGQQQ